jgi:hypothetical protein
MSVRIEHIKYRDVVRAHVFDNVTSYDGLEPSIVTYANSATCPGKLKCEELGCLHDDIYENRVGWAFEVYVEAFLKYYGMKGTKSPNYIEAGHSFVGTSTDKWHSGFDASFTGSGGCVWLVQIKFRSNPTEKLSRSDLGTFASRALTLAKRGQVPEMMLFTNLIGPNIFTPEYADGNEQMHVFGRREQEACIDRDPTALELLTLSATVKA